MTLARRVCGRHQQSGQRSSDAAYDCHESCFYWTFTKNVAVGVASGFIIRGQYITVDGNEITDSLGRAYRASTFRRGHRIARHPDCQQQGPAARLRHRGRWAGFGRGTQQPQDRR
jgi:hypothetical protein